MKYYKHIDGLRALAVIAVLLVHLDFAAFSGGFVGVDVFFVISGFLITNIIVKELETTNKFSFINFYTRRVRRIMPALVFTLLISFVLGVWLLNLAKFQVFGGSLATAIVSFSNIFFYKQAGYFDIFSQSSPLLHTWSLGVEEQFYIFWPILLLIVFKVSRKLLLPLLISIFTISLAWSIHRQDANITSLYYLVQFRAFEFAIGGFLAYLFKREVLKDSSSSAVKELLCLLGFVFVLYPVFAYDENTLFPSYNALMPAIGAALLIYAGSARFAGSVLRNKAIGFIGLISYSLYLIHWPLIVFVKTYNEDVGQAFGISTVVKFIILFGSIFIATFMYYLVEQPFRKGIPKDKIKQTFLLTRWSVVIGIFIALGCSIFYSKGWLWRANSPEALKNVTDISKYHLNNWGGDGFTQKKYLNMKKPQDPTDVVLLGDSHMGMLFNGLYQELLKPNDIKAFNSGSGSGRYKFSCFKLPGMINSNKENYINQCGQQYDEAIKTVNKSNATLIISYQYFQKLGALYSDDGKDISIDVKSKTQFSDYCNFTQALDQVRKDISFKKIILIGDVPRSSYIAIDCIAKLKWFNKNSCNNNDSINRNTGALNVNRVLKEYASKHENVYFINPYDTFCKNGYCMNVDKNGTPLYTDGGHLSKTGSIYFISHIKDQLMNMINAPIETD